ncbi:oxidoreductase [Alloalcanivorax mobilis]|uniref:oxidoreductase n=1 Tax=Alloalcanivorax mobilis TaxID=2019569 RepID=UPI000B5B3374|nr:oxidoreductase [Alloalcanivorax mobilis]ASK35952.1 short-chain dehydrogenase/reductase [Alcanivorax sp. N3-2A]|tara:strand:- start:4544 stop:5395 length:852 start_codon:yes stop_codon:yes gene_type:complete
MNKTWLITGCSSGLGLHIAQAAAARGDNVVATARDPDTLRDLAERFPDRVRTARLDVTEPESAAAAIALAERDFGGFDVLVNNAGYGLIGALEEAEPEEYRPMFEVNVFGLIETTRRALPVLRRRRGARIVNLSSGAGISGGAGSGHYSATKFAVEGLSEALAREVAPLGVRVIIVEPGPFRTGFLGRSIATAEREMEVYAGTAGQRRAYRESNDGRQAGDPEKAAAVILRAVDADHPPLHLPLGPVAYGIAERKLEAFRSDMEAWRSVAIDTDYGPTAEVAP